MARGEYLAEISRLTVGWSRETASTFLGGHGVAQTPRRAVGASLSAAAVMLDGLRPRESL
jgi:hypothetical protein